MRNPLALAALAGLVGLGASAAELHINQLDYLDTQGLSVLVYQNQFHDVFRDQKLGGVEMILHGERIATDGEVRLLPAPEQWDAVPKFTARTHGAQAEQLLAFSGYPDLGLRYRIEVSAEADGFRIAVHLDQTLPPGLVGKAGFNLDFLPTAYFGKSYLCDDHPAFFRATRAVPCGAVPTASRSQSLWPPGIASYSHRRTHGRACRSSPMANRCSSSMRAIGPRTAGSCCAACCGRPHR
jgi:endoglucanase